MSVADSVTNRPVCGQLRENAEEWCGCVSGSLPYDEYVAELARAGVGAGEVEPNLKFAKEALAGAGVEVRSEEQLRGVLPTWKEIDNSVFLPHLISARKPA